MVVAHFSVVPRLVLLALKMTAGQTFRPPPFPVESGVLTCDANEVVSAYPHTVHTLQFEDILEPILALQPSGGASGELYEERTRRMRAT